MEYRMGDTRKPDGCYVVFTRWQEHDPDASPEDYLDQDSSYCDAARIEAWRAQEWHFIGVWARADILVVRGGTYSSYTLTSPGLWGIESDSSEEHLESVFKEECAALLADIRAMGNAVEED